MGGAELMRGAIRTAKCDRNVELSAGHREHVGRVVHDLIEGDERKTEGHELDDGPQPNHRGADPHARETVFADRRVDDAFGPETFEQTLRNFVGAVIFGHFFTHQENIWIALQFFRERFVQRLPVSDLAHPVAHGTKV